MTSRLTPSSTPPRASPREAAERRLGALLRVAAQEAQAGPTPRDDPSARLLARHMTERAALASPLAKAKRRRALAMASVAAAVVVVVAALALGLPRQLAPRSARSVMDVIWPARSAFLVWEQDGTRQGQVGVVYRARKDQPLELLFPEGGLLSLEPGGEMEVLVVDSEERKLRLGRGILHLRVPPQRSSRWALHAGQHRVEVTGTAFTLGYERGASPSLSLAVERGAVRVSGPALPVEGRQVLVGQTLRLGLRRTGWALIGELAAEPVRMGNATGDSRTLPDDGTGESAHGEIPPGSLGETSQVRIGQTPSAGHAAREGLDRATSPEERWTLLYDTGEHRALVSDARRRGLPGLLGSLEARELWLLAQSARYAGEPRLSLDALEQLRKRHARSQQARQASYLMARIQHDHFGNRSLACRLFGQYLNESRWDVLVEEALGRRIVSCGEAGDLGSARLAAQRYLREYPRGIFRNQALKAVGQGRQSPGQAVP